MSKEEKIKVQEPPRQATLAECNRQMEETIKNESKLVTMKGQLGKITVPVSEENAYRAKGYQRVPDQAATSEVDPNAGSGGDEPKFTFKDVEYTKAELMALAEKASLPKTVKSPKTIIAKLTELDFDPAATDDAGSGGDE